MFRQNIGTVNALIRITCGLTLVSYGTAKLVKQRANGNTSLLTIIMGAMKVAEGITRFCPVVYLYDQRRDQFISDFSADDYDEYSPVNPS